MTRKTGRNVVIAYLVLCVIAIAVESRVTHRKPMSSPMDKILLAPIAWGFAVYGVLDGFVRGRLSTVERSERPFTFWTNIVFYVLFGLVCLGWGIGDALR